MDTQPWQHQILSCLDRHEREVLLGQWLKKDCPKVELKGILSDALSRGLKLEFGTDMSEEMDSLVNMLLSQHNPSTRVLELAGFFMEAGARVDARGGCWTSVLHQAACMDFDHPDFSHDGFPIAEKLAGEAARFASEESLREGLTALGNLSGEDDELEKTPLETALFIGTWPAIKIYLDLHQRLSIPVDFGKAGFCLSEDFAPWTEQDPGDGVLVNHLQETLRLLVEAGFDPDTSRFSGQSFGARAAGIPLLHEALVLFGRDRLDQGLPTAPSGMPIPRL
jgi:hypothetical protein